MEAALGYQDLQAELQAHPPPEQILCIDLAGRDPDDGVTSIPYEKGALFLRELDRTFGMAWGIGGWLVFPFLQKIGPVESERLRQRVLAELKTTFASHYTRVVSLQEALQLSNLAIYARRSTGEKFLINPNKTG